MQICFRNNTLPFWWSIRFLSIFGQH